MAAGVLLVLGVGAYVLLRGNAAGSTNTIAVTRGEYSDIVEIRGQIQPVKLDCEFVGSVNLAVAGIDGNCP